MHRAAAPLGLLAALALAAQRPGSPGGATPAPEPAGEGFREAVAPLIEQRCKKCHAGAEAEGELDLGGFLDGTRALDDAATWRAVRRQIALGKMPPRKEPRPPPSEVESALRWIEALLARDPAGRAPGRVTLRRLNRVEYRNSVRDLVGVDYDVEAHFPVDDAGYGFDTIGDVLSMPDVLVEKYLAAAEAIAARAVTVPDPRHPPARRIRDGEVVHSEKVSTGGGAWSLYSHGFVGTDFDFERPGEYLLRARAWAQQAGSEPARMRFLLGTLEVAAFDVLATNSEPALFEVSVEVAAGEQRFAVEFLNDFWNPDEPDRKKRDRNLYVEWLEVAGPLGFCEPTEFQRRALSDPAAPLAEVLAPLVERAWRRPAEAADVAALAALAPEDAPREERLRTALTALLASPRFLFRVESDPPGARPGSVRALDGFELATRLAYFLWSTFPDRELFEAARSGRLAEPSELQAQARRMLADPRASELARNFAGQWLQLRTLERVQPDARAHPEFTDGLRAAMRAETEMLFEAVLREGRAVSELIDPDFTFLNEELARHYGIEGVEGPLPRRVALDAAQRETRGGLLAQASVLTVTSNPTRTSPVKRGKWILETLLGSPPLAPQPGVDSLDERPEAVAAASLRERLARHRADPSCAVCHDGMDQLGFALENYGPTGKWRTQAEGFPVDSAGVLEDGTPLDGPGALERRIARDPAFVRCLAEKLATYALGRGLGPADAAAFDALEVELGASDPRLAELVLAIVRLEAFRTTVVAEGR
jgi:hypothetical protein